MELLGLSHPRLRLLQLQRYELSLSSETILDSHIQKTMGVNAECHSILYSSLF